MLSLQDQTCTREQGAHLVELGVKPVSTFYHMPAKDGPHGEYIQYGWSSNATAPAFTVAELGDMLPFGFESGKDAVDYGEGDMYGYSCNSGDGETYHLEFHNTEAQARAAMLVHLLDNNLITLPEHWKEDPANACHGGTCKRTYSPDMHEIQPLPMPSYHEREMPVFNAVWVVLKGCTIQMPKYYTGYQEVNGCHVKLIADAIEGKYDEGDNAVPGA